MYTPAAFSLSGKPVHRRAREKARHLRQRGYYRETPDGPPQFREFIRWQATRLEASKEGENS